MGKMIVNVAGHYNDKHKAKEFEALALPLLNRLYATALSMTKRPLDAEDLVQDTYLKAWRFYHQFQPGTNIRAWMFRILTTTFINRYRSRKRENVGAILGVVCRRQWLCITLNASGSVQRKFYAIQQNEPGAGFAA